MTKYESRCDYEVHNNQSQSQDPNLNLFYCYNCQKRICPTCFNHHNNIPKYQSHKYELLQEGINKALLKREDIITHLIHIYPKLKGNTNKEGTNYINNRMSNYTKMLNSINNIFRNEYSKYMAKYKEFDKVKNILKESVEKSNKDSLILMQLSNLYDNTNKLYNELVLQLNLIDNLFDLTNNLLNQDNSNNNNNNCNCTCSKCSQKKNNVFVQQKKDEICLAGDENFLNQKEVINKMQMQDEEIHTDSKINDKDNDNDTRLNSQNSMYIETEHNKNSNNNNINNEGNDRNNNMNKNEGEKKENNKNCLILNFVQTNENNTLLTNKKMKRDGNIQNENQNQNNNNKDKDKKEDEQSFQNTPYKKQKIYKENSTNQNTNSDINTSINTSNNLIEEEQKNNNSISYQYNTPKKNNVIINTLNSVSTSYNNIIINNNNNIIIPKSPIKAEKPLYLYNIRAVEKLNNEIAREIIVLVAKKKEGIVLKSFQSHQINHDKVNIFSNKFPLDHSRLINNNNLAYVVGGKRSNDCGNNLCYKIWYLDNDANGGIGEIRCNLLKSTNYKHFSHSLLFSKKYNIIFALSGFNQTKCEYGIIDGNGDIDKWEEMHHLRTPRANAISFILNERYIYLIGGKEKDENNFEIFDIMSIFGNGEFSWKNVDYVGSNEYNKNLFRRKGAGIVVCNEIVYVFGGYQNNLKEFMAWKIGFPDLFNLIIERFENDELPKENGGNSYYGQQLFETWNGHYMNINLNGKLMYMRTNVLNNNGFN